MTEKLYLTAQGLLEDSYRLGVMIYESGFRPDFIVGIWRGGTPVGIAVQELLDYYGIDSDHISLRTSLYTGINQVDKRVRVHGLGYLVRNLNVENTLLIVDDVFDSGRSVNAVIESLTERTRRNTPHQVKIATPWYKPTSNITSRKPDYYLHETDQWLVFPHELHGLNDDELKQGKGTLYDIMRSANPPD